MVPAGGGGCCRACGCAGPHWRGFVVVVFLCVCGLDGCFSDNQGLYWPVWISLNFITKPLSRIGTYVVATFFLSPSWWSGGGCFGRQVHG